MANLETVQSLLPQQQIEFKSEAIRLGAIEASFVKLEKALSYDIYNQWLDKGLNAEMEYLSRHAPIKENPQSKWPSMKSALVFLVPYKINAKSPLKHTRTALYSQELDYHESLKEQFLPLIQSFQNNFPDQEFLFTTDSSPIMERDLAYKAGLGWFGKNSCLINRKHGSLVYIAEILTSLKVDNGNIEKVSDFCGTCTRCIDSCPTDAINDNRTLDSNKCIAYWTIESKKLPPVSLAKNFNDWAFGCDICQTVCPWNEKANGKDLMRSLSAEFQNKTVELEEELRWILNVSQNGFKEAFNKSPILRTKHHGLKRNALIVIANQKMTSLKPEVESYLEDDKLSDLAHWVIGCLNK